MVLRCLLFVTNGLFSSEILQILYQSDAFSNNYSNLMSLPSLVHASTRVSGFPL